MPDQHSQTMMSAGIPDITLSRHRR